METPATQVIVPRHFGNLYIGDVEASEVDAPWFFQEDRIFDARCENALIALGINNKECPGQRYGGWAAFIFASTIIQILTRSCLEIPQYIPLRTDNELKHFIWRELYTAWMLHQFILDPNFMATMLREFLPQYHDAGPNDRPYTESKFVEHWGGGLLGYKYCDEEYDESGNLKQRYHKIGREAFSELPINVQVSITMVSNRIPKILKAVVDHIKTIHQY